MLMMVMLVMMIFMVVVMMLVTMTMVMASAVAVFVFDFFVMMMFDIFHNATFFPLTHRIVYCGAFRRQKYGIHVATGLQTRSFPHVCNPVAAVLLRKRTISQHSAGR